MEVKNFKLRGLTLEQLEDKLFYAEEECKKAYNYYKNCKIVAEKYKQRIEKLKNV